MKIKEDMYVRTKQGKIGKIIDINLGQEEKRYILDSSSVYIYCEEDISKASHNTIDLIEVGDYVNGYKVYYCYCADEDSTDLFIDTEKGRQWLDKPSQVKSIVTKEQFESMKYSLEG